MDLCIFPQSRDNQAFISLPPPGKMYHTTYKVLPKRTHQFMGNKRTYSTTSLKAIQSGYNQQTKDFVSLTNKLKRNKGETNRLRDSCHTSTNHNV